METKTYMYRGELRIKQLSGIPKQVAKWRSDFLVFYDDRTKVVLGYMQVAIWPNDTFQLYVNELSSGGPGVLFRIMGTQ